MVVASVRFVAPGLPDRVSNLEPPSAPGSWSKSVPSVVILSVSDIHTILLP